MDNLVVMWFYKTFQDVETKKIQRWPELICAEVAISCGQPVLVGRGREKPQRFLVVGLVADM